ncbi:MAG: hypothetical protein IJR89_03790 [Clostridia bacterium]|nr:hypothetical protein [Clostridia bacterium]
MRGCQKKMIRLKGMGDTVFEEAYFILRDEERAPVSENALVLEAERIVEENALLPARRERRGKTRLCWFLGGVSAALSAALLFRFFFG